jgi:hypothetical protein
MDSEKTKRRADESVPESSGDRRAGSVGERPELAGSRDSGDRSAGSHKRGKHSVEDEIAGDSANDPGLGGE